MTPFARKARRHPADPWRDQLGSRHAARVSREATSANGHSGDDHGLGDEEDDELVLV
jgi:hypothetical protein